MNKFKPATFWLFTLPLLLIVFACKPETTSGRDQTAKSSSVEAFPLGEYSGRRGISPDDFVNEYYEASITDSGGSIQTMTQINPVDLRKPCPCCPDWHTAMYLRVADVKEDSLPPGCCYPCHGYDFLVWLNGTNSDELPPGQNELMTFEHTFPADGLVIAEVAVDITPRTKGGSPVDIDFSLSLQGSEVSQMAAGSDKSWNSETAGPIHWVTFRKQFQVGAGPTTFTLNGDVQTDGSDFNAGGRSVHLSYFPE